MSFTHLQVRSGYTLHKSTITIDQLVKKAKSLHFDTLALTDESVLYGAISFYQACQSHGIKPILGLIVHIDSPNGVNVPCILLAKSNRGYEQLMQISTYIQKQNKPQVEQQTIAPLLKEIIGILPLHTSPLGDLLANQAYQDARAYIQEWRSIFADGDFYLGIGETDLVSGRLDTLKTFQQSTGLSVVALQDVRYVEQTDHEAYDCLQHMKEDRQWSPSEMATVPEYKHLRSQEEMEQLFSDTWPEALEATADIQAKCHVTLDFNRRLLPAFPTPNGTTADDYLEACCLENIVKKYEHVTNEIKERLHYELDVIRSMNFSDYFLIVSDFIAYAKHNNIRVGPGRGSAAGSIVAYILGITNVDPIQYNLLFERFLNPERMTMPDIDVDFSDHRRDEVIEYVREKYGTDHVAQIITFGTFGVRSTLRELFKTMAINDQDAQFILNEIPQHAYRSIAYYVRQSQDLATYIKQSDTLKKLFTIATKLEGLPRNISTHAAGVIISDAPLIQYTPLTIAANGGNLTQYAMSELETIGLLKMDFLGLRNLTFIEHIMNSIQRTLGKQLVLDDIPLDDEQTYTILQKGLTNGVFQLESAGMKDVLEKLKPTTFEDIVAVNALYRPGPMENIPLYIKNKHHPAQIDYMHKKLAPILTSTYGVLIYQEQIIQIAHDIAGLTLGEADVFRRIISKKQGDKINDQRETFVSGCQQNGLDQESAEGIFNWIVKFSNYGFNRSHAVAYSKIAYQLAYLKAHYPTFFFAELLSSLSSQDHRMHQYIREANALHIALLMPSINKSIGKFSVEHDALRMGLLTIKGIGHQVVKEILKKRKDKRFTSLFDFCLRVSIKIVNRKSIETLILAGAFDDMNKNRASLLASLDQAIDQGELFGGLNNSISLLPDQYGIKEMYTKIDDFTQMKKLSDEKELLGVYISNHPLSDVRNKLTSRGYMTISESKQHKQAHMVKSVVIIQSIKKIRTKRGESMAFLTLSDETEDIDGVVFPSLYRHVSRLLDVEKIVVINGKSEERNNRLQWLISTLQPFEYDTFIQSTKQLFIKLTNDNNVDALDKIRHIASQHPGTTPILIYHEMKNKTYKLAKQYQVDDGQACIQALKDIFGSEHVVLQT